MQIVSFRFFQILLFKDVQLLYMQHGLLYSDRTVNQLIIRLVVRFIYSVSQR